ncbi:cell division protein FtsZ [Candidatus Chloroploca sp. Khr17]|uniref:cell division protein FtsZ n=1 Tax=Candidatus Chloroploca sp. Khr17 TaxID=2496869 RepID=UPI00101CB4AA|nr:cell division protein FtsZ [Candidatus Chloroploca sp. Khr17]
MAERLIFFPASTYDQAPFQTDTDVLTVSPPELRIRVIGVGGAGGNVINCLVKHRMAAIDTLAANTDRQALSGGRAGGLICLGENLTRGLGAGGNPEVGRHAAEESLKALTAALRGADMVFIAAGMGGGTGTGAAPIVAEVARELGALTVALVTRPFSFEGRRRARTAEEGLEALRAVADTVIVVPNDRLLQVAGRSTTVRESFSMADAVLRHGVQGIADLVTNHGLINVDFADVRTIMSEAGPALLGIGSAQGADRAVEAARRAMACPLLEGRLEGASRLLLHVSGDEDLGLFEVERVAEMVARTIDPDANIILGATIDPTMNNGSVKVTLVATGFSLQEPVPLAQPYAMPSRINQVKPRAAPTEPVSVREQDALDIPPFLKRFRQA